MPTTVQYRYTGALTSVTLADQADGVRELALHPGETYELPADHPHVRGLIAQQLLVPVDAATEPARDSVTESLDRRRPPKAPGHGAVATTVTKETH